MLGTFLYGLLYCNTLSPLFKSRTLTHPCVFHENESSQPGNHQKAEGWGKRAMNEGPHIMSPRISLKRKPQL